MYASSEGSGKSVHLRRHDWAFNVRQNDKYTYIYIYVLTRIEHHKAETVSTHKRFIWLWAGSENVNKSRKKMDFFQWAVHFFVACYQMIIYCYAHLYAISNQISKKIHMLCFLRTQCCNVDSWLIAGDESSTLFLPCTLATVALNIWWIVQQQLWLQMQHFLNIKKWQDYHCHICIQCTPTGWGTLNTTLVVLWYARGYFGGTLNTTMTVWRYTEYNFGSFGVHER